MTEDEVVGEQVGVRFLVVHDMPLVAVDVRDEQRDRPAARAGGLFQRVTEAGVPVLPGFFGVDLPRGAAVGWTLSPDALTLQDGDGEDLLELPRAALDEQWCRRALQLRGTMFVLATDLGLGPEDDPSDVAHRIDAAARDGRMAAAIVGVVEPRVGLPIFG